MIKLIAMMMTVVLVLSLSACGSSNGQKEETVADTAASTEKTEITVVGTGSFFLLSILVIIVN